MMSFCANDLAKKDEKKVSLEVDEKIELADDIATTGNTVGKVEFQLRNNFIIIDGKFETPVRLVCDRCTMDYDMNLKFDIDEAIEVSDAPVPTEEQEFTAENFHEQVAPGEKIDILDYIRQYIILNLPGKKLCSEVCINDDINAFNSKAEDEVDPRWEKLKSLKDKIKGE
jgi:uncharacterized metal-binding protein YceD (DUF177 family)